MGRSLFPGRMFLKHNFILFNSKFELILFYSILGLKRCLCVLYSENEWPLEAKTNAGAVYSQALQAVRPGNQSPVKIRGRGEAPSDHQAGTLCGTAADLHAVLPPPWAEKPRGLSPGPSARRAAHGPFSQLKSSVSSVRADVASHLAASH